MPKGVSRKKNPELYEKLEAAEALAKAKIDSAAADAALDAAAGEGVNKFAQEQARQLLERVEADVTARADEPSGIELGVDYNFLRDDPTDHTPLLERKGLEVKKDLRYHWINRDPRRIERRRNQGWEPVAGGSIVRGDAMLAAMPEAKAKKIDQVVRERTKLAANAHMDRLAAEGKKLGMDTFDGNRSLRDGLD